MLDADAGLRALHAEPRALDAGPRAGCQAARLMPGQSGSTYKGTIGAFWPAIAAGDAGHHSTQAYGGTACSALAVWLLQQLFLNPSSTCPKQRWDSTKYC